MRCTRVLRRTESPELSGSITGSANGCWACLSTFQPILIILVREHMRISQGETLFQGERHDISETGVGPQIQEVGRYLHTPTTSADLHILPEKK